MSTAEWHPRANESVRWRGHPRWTRAMPGIAVSVLLLIGSGVVAVSVSAIAFLGLGLAVLPGTVHYLRVRKTVFVLTERGVIIKTGVIGRSVRRLRYDHMQDVSYGQSLTGRVFDHGTVTVTVAGGDQLQLSGIREPTTPYELIRTATGAGTSSIPGSLRTWQAIRDELQAVSDAVDSHQSR